MTLDPDQSAGSAPQAHPSSRRLSFTSVEVVLFVIAGGLGFLSDQFSLPWLTEPALLFGGLLLVVLGVQQIVSRLDAYRGVATYAQAVELYKALVVQLWGVIMLGLGLMIDFRAILGFFDPSAADAIFNGMLNSTPVIGVIVAAIGLMTTLHGLIRLLAGRNDEDEANVTGFRDAIYRLAGVAILLLGLAAAFVGVFLVLAPDALRAFLTSLAGSVVGP